MTQTRLNSLIESLIGALLAAPSSQIIHWYLIELWGNTFATPETKLIFLQMSWISFFIHSVFWKFAIRRVLVYYNAENLTELIRRTK